MTEAELDAALAGARFALLGEFHDAPDHHRLQARAIEAMVARGRAPSVVFEMLTRDQQDAVDEARAAPPPPAPSQRIRGAVGWDESGWPDFAIYEPVFAAALAADLPIVAGDLPDADREALGSDVPPPDLVARYGLEQPLPPEIEAQLAGDIEAAHCGHAPGPLLPRMIRVQRARDASLAQALFERAADGAVLIAGTEHVRLDRGAPRVLRSLAPGDDVVAVAFLEVDDGDPVDPAALLAERYDGELPFDFVRFTPRLPRPDPCERFRDALEGLAEEDPGA